MNCASAFTLPAGWDVLGTTIAALDQTGVVVAPALMALFIVTEPLSLMERVRRGCFFGVAGDCDIWGDTISRTMPELVSSLRLSAVEAALFYKTFWLILG